MDLELLDPGDDDELGFLLEALHQGGRDATGGDHDLAAIGEAASPRLHVTMHQIVARQILACDPPQTWQTVQRLAGLSYGWHAIMHMIAGLVAEDVHAPWQSTASPIPKATPRGWTSCPPAGQHPETDPAKVAPDTSGDHAGGRTGPDRRILACRSRRLR